MSKMSPIVVIERYEEHRLAIQRLLQSILTCFADGNLFEQSQAELSESLNSLCSYYPFVSLLYLLGADGVQISTNIPGRFYNDRPNIGDGADRSKRPYFIAAQQTDQVVVTEPYLSSVKNELCLSVCCQVFDNEAQVKGYIVLDVDLPTTLNFLSGETMRANFEPGLKGVYSLIVFGLFTVAAILLYSAANECIQVIYKAATQQDTKLIPFSMVIYLTLALAIFDLAKTTLEEEVLLYKDILKHSSTRRTITRFIAAIIIALSIEALLMIFKSALQNSGQFIIEAVWVVIAAAFLLLCLGVYVYLGARAEVLLRKQK
ncbi:cache domain-containing protein [Methylomonas sp. AM2-LC]|uniref:PDC sensor domain-containing protein n=1 Tax=Methylomonas sp. AM2-LC TaxID=3153301 RepID=UPI003262EA9C